MTHLLEIRDDEDALLYNLLFASVGNAAITSLSSRQIIPLNDGRWEERFRIFSGSANMAPDVSCSILDLDKTVKSISDYGENPAYNAPIWLYEKNEGEAALTRRAPLFSASQQPVQEGAIGQLLINSGYTGLLTIERGDWEDIELTTTVVSQAITDYFGTEILEARGSVNGRISSLILSTTDLKTTTFSVGIRGNNFGIANFQPCVNWGAGESDNGGYQSLPGSATEPLTQPSPTYNSVGWYHGALPDSITIDLSAVSLSFLDSVNQDYVGEYGMFLRYGFSHGAIGNNNVFVKVTPYYGYGGNYIYNDPVYIDVMEDDAVSGDYWHSAYCGRVNIPSRAYVYEGVSADSLAAFKFGLDIEIIGTISSSMLTIMDSTILIPINNITLSAADSTDWETDVVTKIKNAPDGSMSLLSTGANVTGDISTGMTVPSNGGVLVYFNERYDFPTGSPTRIITLESHARYNSTSG